MLASFGLSHKDEAVLKSLMDLLGSRTDDEWQYAGRHEADAVILDFDHPDTAKTWGGMGWSETRVPIAYTTHKPGAFRFHLSKPMRAADLIAVLQDIEQFRGGSDAAMTGPDGVSDGAPEKEPASTLAQVISDNGAGLVRLTCPDGVLILDRDAGQSLTTLDTSQIKTLVGQPLDQIDWQPCPAEDADVANVNGWVRDQKALWWIGLLGSHGRLLDSLSRDGRYRLTRWPSPSQIKGAQQDLDLCGLLSRRAGVTLNDLLEVPGIQQEHAVGFLNAAALTGILKPCMSPESTAAPESREVPRERKGLFAKIRARLTSSSQ